MIKKLWVIRDLHGGRPYKQADVLARSKEQAIVLFLMAIDPEKYPDESTAKKYKDNCSAIAVLNVYRENWAESSGEMDNESR